MSAPSTPSASGPSAEKTGTVFSERETKLLAAAMLSLKSGDPEVDYQKFVKHGEFNTVKTAQNTWGALKKKLAGLNAPAADEGNAADGATLATPKTKAKATPKKRVKKEAGSDDDFNGDKGVADGEDKPSAAKKLKTPRMTAAQKKADAAAAGGDDSAEATGSPTKKIKKTPRKAAAMKESVAAAADEEADTGAEVKNEETAEEDKEGETAATETAVADTRMEDAELI